MLCIVQIVRQGSSNDRPQHGQLVDVKCCGHLQDETEIDKHDCLRLTLGNADLVSGDQNSSLVLQQ